MGELKFPAFFAAILFILVSCADIQSLPEEPKIEFKSFAIFDTTDILGNTAKGGRLKFYFEDGDGNVGLPAPTPGVDSDSLNLFFSLYRVQKGVRVPAPDNDPFKPSGYRIPYMEKTGQNKILQGTVSVTFLYLFYSANDTISYDFYIMDRAENQSNTASTVAIPVFVNGVYE